MMTKQRPNILFILTDQQRADTMSCYGGRVCQTPHLDELSRESVVFDNAYASCPVCTPARASLQTGLYPHRHGMETNNYWHGCMVHELPDYPQLLSRQLRQQKYSAGYTGKWHLGAGNTVWNDVPFKQFKGDVHFWELENDRASLPTNLGYEGDDFPGHGAGGHRYPQYQEYLKEHGLTHEIKNKVEGHYDRHYAAEVVSPIESTIDYYLTERAIRHIGEFKDREEPFYYQLNFWGPHEPYVAPSKHLRLYDDVEIEPWLNFRDTGENKPSIHQVKRARSTDWETFVPYIKHYYAFMSSIDEQIGRLLQYLKDNGLYENTMIIFSSDHGESLGIHGGLCDKGFFMYEETCRIPLLIKPAGESGEGRKEKRFAGTCDIYSTILDFAGVSLEKAERDGRSLLPLVRGEAVADWPDHAVTEGSGLEYVLITQRMIRKGELKYVFNSAEIDELYDLANDPHELVNLIKDPEYKEALWDMQDTLAHWMEQHHDGLLKQFRILRLDVREAARTMDVS